MDIVSTVVVVFGVVLGYFITEKLLKRKEIKKREILSVNELPEYLHEKYMVKSAILIDNKEFRRGVSDEELKEAMNLAVKDEVILISGTDLKYILKRDNVFVYVSGKISLKDFVDIWFIIQKSLEVVK